jgi:3-hydroxyisobutyrate dehydrogenase
MSATDDSRETPPAAVVGIGIMGSAMARNLVAAGLPTTVWDRSAAATTLLADAGARVAGSASEAVRDARVVITMLPTPDVVQDVIFDSGAAGQFAEGAAWVQMGTIGVAATEEIARRWPGNGAPPSTPGMAGKMSASPGWGSRTRAEHLGGRHRP